MSLVTFPTQYLSRTTIRYGHLLPTFAETPVLGTGSVHLSAIRMVKELYRSSGTTTWVLAMRIANLNYKDKRMLTNTFYLCDSCCFTFEKYIQWHKDAHIILHKLESEGYSALDGE
jgi:hypothetical protein